MELETSLYQPRQTVDSDRATPIPETNFEYRTVFQLFRYLELHAQRLGIISEVYLLPKADPKGQRLNVVVNPIDSQNLTRLLSYRPGFEAIVERAFLSSWCPVLSSDDTRYPKEWLRMILPVLGNLGELRRRQFMFTEVATLEYNSELEATPNLFPYYHYEGEVGYIDLTVGDDYEGVYDTFLQELLEVLRDFWSGGVVAMTKEEALRWQCQLLPEQVVSEYLPLYRLQNLMTNPTEFLFERLRGRPHFVWVGANKVAKHAAADLLKSHQLDTIFFRDSCAVEIRSWRDYALIGEVRRVALSARGEVSLSGEPTAGAIQYFELTDSDQIAIYSTFSRRLE